MSTVGIFVKTNPKDKKTIATLFVSTLGKTVFCIHDEYWLDSFCVDGTVTLKLGKLERNSLTVTSLRSP